MIKITQDGKDIPTAKGVAFVVVSVLWGLVWGASLLALKVYIGLSLLRWIGVSI